MDDRGNIVGLMAVGTRDILHHGGIDSYSVGHCRRGLVGSGDQRAFGLESVMTRSLGIGLSALGLVLMLLGFNESQSFASEISQIFQNTPSDRAIWLLASGGIAMALGCYVSMSRI